MAPVIDWFLNGQNLAALIAAASAAGAFLQYRRNSIRQKNDLAQSQAVTAARETLALLGNVSAQDALSALDYSEPTTMRALEIHAATYETNPKAKFSEEEKAARDKMDVLLTRLEMINFLIDRGVISATDFESHFAYWLELLGEVPGRNPPDKLVHFSDANRRKLWNYIRVYRFHGVIELFKRYGRASSGTGTPEDLFVARQPAS